MAINVEEANKQLSEALVHFQDQLKKLRTGRANASMLDGVKVELYGQETPLSHVATISVVDAQLLQVAPFDPNSLEAISNAIRDDNTLGLNPADDGRVVRLPIPAMTSDRRQEVVKVLNEKVEQVKISFRNTRHELLNSLKQQVSDKEISEDDKNRAEKQFQDLLDKQTANLEETATNKEKEILTV